jgi:hypothetical protein
MPYASTKMEATGIQYNTILCTLKDDMGRACSTNGGEEECM